MGSISFLNVNELSWINNLSISYCNADWFSAYRTAFIHRNWWNLLWFDQLRWMKLCTESLTESIIWFRFLTIKATSVFLFALQTDPSGDDKSFRFWRWQVSHHIDCYNPEIDLCQCSYSLAHVCIFTFIHTCMLTQKSENPNVIEFYCCNRLV